MENHILHFAVKILDHLIVIPGSIKPLKNLSKSN